MVRVDLEKCDRCGTLDVYECIDTCPHRAITLIDVSPEELVLQIENGIVVPTNEDRCIECDRCTEVCPLDVISIEEEGSSSQVNSGNKIHIEERCFGCGNCVVVCSMNLLVEIDTSICDKHQCKRCWDKCPEKAIKLA